MSVSGSAPRAFVSHASEDKDRFVLAFAAALRTNGVDAWLDRWEMHAGDSLVDRIFEVGIEGADAFIVVLSKVSVDKPWVREELDAGVIRRIEGRTLLIPVVLDADIEVPAALRHLLWISVPDRSFDGALEDVLDAIFRRDKRPPIGPPPGYAAAHSTKYVNDPVDNIVFGTIVDLVRETSEVRVLDVDAVLERVARDGISENRVDESLLALTAQGLVRAEPLMGNDWLIHGIPNRVWLQIEQRAGVDLTALRRQLLAHAVNVGGAIDAATFPAHRQTVDAVLDALEGEGLVHVIRALGGDIHVMALPLARRALRDF